MAFSDNIRKEDSDSTVEIWTPMQILSLYLKEPRTNTKPNFPIYRIPKKVIVEFYRYKNDAFALDALDKI